MVIKNIGNKPTFVRKKYGSVLDLTLATGKVGSTVHDWRVLDLESLSDHKYILFAVEKCDQQDRTLICRGWNARRLNKEKLVKAIETIEVCESNTSPEGFHTKMEELCGECMPKIEKRRNTNAKYWWNEDLAQLRSKCLRKRRRYTRGVKNNNAEIEVIWEEYVQAKKDLQNTIPSSKSKEWKKVCDKVDRDIWGKG